jgi:hypothetical protein
MGSPHHACHFCECTKAEECMLTLSLVYFTNILYMYAEYVSSVSATILITKGTLKRTEDAHSLMSVCTCSSVFS